MALIEIECIIAKWSSSVTYATNDHAPTNIR